MGVDVLNNNGITQEPPRNRLKIPLPVAMVAAGVVAFIPGNIFGVLIQDNANNEAARIVAPLVEVFPKLPNSKFLTNEYSAGLISGAISVDNVRDDLMSSSRAPLLNNALTAEARGQFVQGVKNDLAFRLKESDPRYLGSSVLFVGGAASAVLGMMFSVLGVASTDTKKKPS